jgi:hypothetical protein
MTPPMKTERKHRVKTDYGSVDYFKFFKKNNKDSKISGRMFGSVLREFNLHISNKLSEKGAEYIFPNKIGKIELRKIKTEVKIDEKGKLVNNLPTNWKATIALWNSSQKSKAAMTKIKFTNEHTDGHTFRIFYIRSKANFKNKSIYKMQFNRDMKRDLSKSIFEGRIDAFLTQ